jgi:glycosyltransferase involved in cell wall biosynthesis
MWKFRQVERSADRRFEDWLSKLSKSQNGVLLGANFAEYGGVRGHLKAIQKYSRHKIELAPPDSLIDAIGLYRCQVRMGKALYTLDTSAMIAIHSHVFPLFTEWCHHQQQQNRTFWVHTYHLNYYPEHARSALPQWMLDINRSLLEVARNADVRISVSEWQKRELADIHSIDTICVPNGVDLEKCLTASGTRFRERYGLRSFVLYVGRNDPVKNPEEFVALARLLEDIPCVMIGGDLSDQTMADLCGELPANLRTLGAQPANVVADAIAAASVVVVTSRREGLPTLVLEVLAQNTPLVVPDEPGCLEAVGGGQFAEVYSLGDMESLRRKVLSLLQYRGRTDSALDFLKRTYDWRVIIPRLDAIYSTRGGNLRASC